jgi:hypothetical protein
MGGVTMLPYQSFQWGRNRPNSPFLRRGGKQAILAAKRPSKAFRQMESTKP